jgi:probable addiction module antidote protein
MNKKIKTNHIDYKEWLLQELQDPKLALDYLNEALADEDQTVFLIALKDVLEAQDGDMTAVAREAHISRQNLYRMLSKKGNPRWENLTSLLDSLGMQIHLSFKK